MENKKLIYATDARKAILEADPKLSYIIDNLPGINAVEVENGFWIEEDVAEGFTAYRCSKCNASSILNTKYCPYCGRIMKGQEKIGED